MYNNEEGCIKFIVAIILIILMIWSGADYFKHLMAAINYAPNCAWAKDPITCAESVRSQYK